MDNSKIRKIAYIVPTEDGVALGHEILEGLIDKGIVDVLCIDLKNIESEYNRLVREGYGYIIARGGTYNELYAIKGAIPVMEQRILSVDVIKSLQPYMDTEESVAVFLHNSAALGFEMISEQFRKKVNLRRYEMRQELSEMLYALETDSTVVVSPIARDIVNRDDINIVPISYAAGQVRSTVEEAHKLMVQLQESLQRANLIDNLFDNVDEGIVMFMPDNRVVDMNKRAEQLLGIRRSKAVGNLVNKFVPELPERKNDGTCSIDTPTNFTGVVENRTLSYTVYPFEFYTDDTRYIIMIQDVTRLQEMEQSIRRQLSKKGHVANKRFSDIRTDDPCMCKVIERAKILAGREGSVLIYGESGTGKELFAQSIHNASRRANGPFVAVNCGALAESLLESELFGYVGGAFTGARKEGKAGLFELAHNGTIFLDEINSMPLNLQTKLLRVLEQREVMRVGSDYVIPLNIRIVSASNGNLLNDVEEGRFRRDLYYRLDDYHLDIPPVRERRADIVMLFKHYLARYAENNQRIEDAADIQLSPEFEQQLLAHDWHGNVREIRSVALRYDAFGGDNSNGDILKVRSSDVPRFTHTMLGGEPRLETHGFAPDPSESIELKDLSKTVEMLVIESLEGQGLSKNEIARTLGISRQALYKKLNK